MYLFCISITVFMYTKLGDDLHFLVTYQPRSKLKLYKSSFLTKYLIYLNMLLMILNCINFIHYFTRKKKFKSKVHVIIIVARRILIGLGLEIQPLPTHDYSLN